MLLKCYYFFPLSFHSPWNFLLAGVVKWVWKKGNNLKSQLFLSYKRLGFGGWGLRTEEPLVLQSKLHGSILETQGSSWSHLGPGMFSTQLRKQRYSFIHQIVIVHLHYARPRARRWPAIRWVGEVGEGLWLTTYTEWSRKASKWTWLDKKDKAKCFLCKFTGPHPLINWCRE